MPDFTAATANSMVDWLTGKTTPAAVANRFITVFDGDPQGAGVEVLNTISGSATRPQLTSQIAAASGGVATSNLDITFTNSAVAGADVDYIAIYSAATAGTLMASSAVNTPKTIVAGDSLKILSGGLTVGIS